MKHVAFWATVVLVSGGLFLLSESGCTIIPASSPAPAFDQRRETELKLRAIIEATFDQTHPDAADLWGTRLKIVEVQGNRFTISAGPDKTFGTNDDEQYSSPVP